MRKLSKNIFIVSLCIVFTSCANSDSSEQGPSNGLIDEETITTGNFENVLEQMVKKLYSSFYQTAFDRMQFTSDITLVSESSSGITTERLYSCGGGGEYQTVDEEGGAFTSFTQILTDCRVDGVLYNGNSQRSTTGGVGSVERWNDYSAVISDTDLIRITYERTSTFASVVSGESLKVTNYEFLNSGIMENIENLQSSVTVNADGIPITGRFGVTVLDGLDDNQTLTLTTLENFTDLVLLENKQISVYTMGRLEIRAADQSQMTIDANNGDPDSFVATVETQGGTVSAIVPWSVRNMLPCLAVNSIDSSACELF